MGDNFHTPWAASVTQFTAVSMNPALASLDQAITYATKSPIVHCDGEISWASSGTLTWASTLRILFCRTDGQTIQNTLATGSIVIADNEMAYVDLSETNDTVLTMSVAAITTGAASNFLALNRFVMAYRNTASNEIYSVWLPMKYSSISSGHSRLHSLDSSLDHYGFSGATADEIVSITSTSLLPKKSGRLITDFLDGRQVDCSTAGTQCTVNWANGGTQYMTLATATTRVTFSNPVNGKVYRLLIKQSAGGSDLITWGSTIKWRGATPPTLTVAGDAVDIATFAYIDSTWYGDVALNFG